MRRRVLSVLVALALVAIIAGCDKSPVSQTQEAKSTLQDAEAAEVNVYAPNLYKQAMDSLNAAEVEIQKQDGKFSTFRDYDRARELLAASTRLTNDATNKAEAEKDRIRVDDSTAIAEIESLIGEASDAIAKAPKVKGSRVDLKVLQADIDAVKGGMTEATGAYQQGDYMAAKSQLDALRTKIMGTKSQIEAAIATKKK
jgi:hypothetical protein